MIARNAKHFMTGVPQPFEKSICLLELFGPRALREISRNDNQVGLGIVDPLLDGLDQPGIMGAKVQVGKVDQAGHDNQTPVTLNLFQMPTWPTPSKMDRTEANTGTRDVAERLQFDVAALESWMADRVEGFEGPLAVSQFKGGQSNPTYRLDTRSGRSFVLRRKPPGKLLPGAHAVDREARVMSALGRQGFPVPRVHGLCEDETVIGTPFFIMDMVDGRIIWEASFPGLSREERAAHFDAMNATIAQLHSYNPEEIGLGDYGRASGFVERQVARWSKQYEGDVEAGRVPAMDALVDWLQKHLPADSGDARVVHGDFRCDNMIFAVNEARVAAVLDWELSTLGDPAADFVYHLIMYRMPSGIFTGLAGLDLEALGIPSEDEYVASYCRRTGRDHLSNVDYLIVFVMFRLAAILHGIKGRLARGSASSSHAAQMVGQLEPLAELALSQALSARL
jgi:aminoglycoside phosphotransferase (APT) family kinase protein